MANDGAVAQRVKARAKSTGTRTRTDLYTKASLNKCHCYSPLQVDTYGLLIYGVTTCIIGKKKISYFLSVALYIVK